MRPLRLFAGVVTTTAVLGALASPATAAPGDITKTSCAAAGGTYASDRGVKSCSVVTTSTTSQPQSQTGLVPRDEISSYEYVAFWDLATTWQTTTTSSQLANRPVYTTTSAPVAVSTSVENLGCMLNRLVDHFLGITLETYQQEVYPEVCAGLGLYPTA